jgi:poly(A)-specific ribonuclease
MAKVNVGLGFDSDTSSPTKQLPQIEIKQEIFEPKKEPNFNSIIQLLIDLKKPIIGHKMIYDLLYIYNQFIAKLPETFLEFSRQWLSFFPATFDISVMFRDNFETECLTTKTDLSHVFRKCTIDKTLSNNLQFSVECKEQSHDAGFDAYMTGRVFGIMSKYVEISHIL